MFNGSYLVCTLHNFQYALVIKFRFHSIPQHSKLSLRNKGVLYFPGINDSSMVRDKGEATLSPVPWRLHGPFLLDIRTPTTSSRMGFPRPPRAITRRMPNFPIRNSWVYCGLVQFSQMPIHKRRRPLQWYNATRQMSRR